MSTVATKVEIKAEEAPFIEQPPQKGDGTVGPAKSGAMPLEIYNQEHQRPYLYDLLELEQELPDGFNNDVSSISDYIDQYVKEHGLNPTTEGYKEAYKEIKRELKIGKETSLETEVERISKYIEAEKIVKTLKGIDEAKLIYLMKSSPTKDIMKLVMKEVERQGL